MRVITLWIAAFLVVPAAAAEVPPVRQAALRHLLFQDCGSCHGLTLQGGLGPALTPAALNGKSPVMLSEVILNGRPGTPMPPWKTFMSKREAEWLVQELLAGARRAH
ncbi:MAG: cytochrome c [Pseudomonadota bacterium]